MSLRKAFQTDPVIERTGVEVDFGYAVVTVARAGGSNRQYKAALAKAVRPLRASIEAETIEDEQLMPIMIDCFVDNCVLNWQTRRSDKTLEVGLEGADGVDGELIPFTKENVKRFLKEMPELYRQLEKYASNVKLFLKDVEIAAKN